MTKESDAETAAFERLCAYVDGALPAEEAQRIAAAAARDQNLARQLDEIRALDAGLTEAFATPENDDAGRRLTALIAEHAPPPDGRRLRRRSSGRALSGAQWTRRRAAPIAASLAASAAAVVVALALTSGSPPEGSPPGAIALGPLAEATPLSAALSTAAYGETRPDGALAWAPRGLFEDGAGRICREFERRAGADVVNVGLACRENGAWRVEFAARVAPSGAAAGQRSGDDLSLAEGPGADALGAYIIGLDPGPQFTAEEERAFLDAAQSAER